MRSHRRDSLIPSLLPAFATGCNAYRFASILSPGIRVAKCFCSSFLNSIKPRCVVTTVYRGWMPLYCCLVGILTTRMMLIGGVLFLSSSGCAMDCLRLSLSSVFLSISPSPFGAVSSLWGGGGRSQGTSGYLAPGFLCGFMGIAAGV